MRLTAFATAAFAATWCGVVVVDASSGALQFPWGWLWTALGLPLTAVLALVFAIRSVRSRGAGRAEARTNFLLTSGFLLAAISALASNWPLRARFLISRDALDSFIANDSTHRGRVGFFWIASVQDEPGIGRTLLLSDSFPGADSYLVHTARVPASDFVDRYRHLGGSWWFLDHQQ